MTSDHDEDKIHSDYVYIYISRLAWSITCISRTEQSHLANIYNLLCSRSRSSSAASDWSQNPFPAFPPHCWLKNKT